MIKILLSCVFLVLFTASAFSQQLCGPRGKFVEYLAKTHAESRVGVGIVNGGGVLELLSSSDGSSWTLIITQPNGQSCVLGSGEAWVSFAHKLEAPA